MKISLFAAVFATLLGAAIVTAADKPGDAKKAPATTQAAAGAVNKICAVEGGDHTVDPDFWVMYKGQKIGFCCDDCIKTFNDEPDKFVDALKKRKDYAEKK